MLISYVPLLVAIVGLLMFVLAANPKVARIGEILMFCGAFVTLLALAHDTARILP